MFGCDVCSKQFQHKNNMYRHRRNVHKFSRATNPKNEYICDHCGFKCELKYQLIRHIRENHNSKRKSGCKPPGSRLKCPECDIYFKKYECLDAHLSQIHQVGIEEEYLEFLNEKEFCTWKLNTEKETQSQYITVRGLRKLPAFSQREYICNRSYQAKLKSTERKRAYKKHVTNKIGAVCPSRMIVKIKDEKVEVNFIRTHVGHSAEVICLRISSDQRAIIAEKLKRGATVQQVLDDVRASSIDKTFQRVHILQKKDIHNIIRDYDIKNVTRSHKNDDVKENPLLPNFPK